LIFSIHLQRLDIQKYVEKKFPRPHIHFAGMDDSG
jgi:hypothetical protein